MKKNPHKDQNKTSLDPKDFDAILHSRRLDLNRLLKERFQDKALEREL